MRKLQQVRRHPGPSAWDGRDLLPVRPLGYVYRAVLPLLAGVYTRRSRVSERYCCRLSGHEPRRGTGERSCSPCLLKGGDCLSRSSGRFPDKTRDSRKGRRLYILPGQRDALLAPSPRHIPTPVRPEGHPHPGGSTASRTARRVHISTPLHLQHERRTLASGHHLDKLRCCWCFVSNALVFRTRPASSGWLSSAD